jgi:hypothetical protein
MDQPRTIREIAVKPRPFLGGSRDWDLIVLDRARG